MVTSDAFKKYAKLCIPPIILLAKQKLFTTTKSLVISLGDRPVEQDVELYWNEEYADILEKWGEGTVWQEVQLLFAGLEGRVLDIACGTGPTIEVLSRLSGLDVHGFDLSDVLIRRAVEKGILPHKLKVADATLRCYAAKEFDYSYSIGSIEHFTEGGIELFLQNAAYYTSRYSFHMLPVNINGIDKGWEKTSQSYFNNSVEWWLTKFRPHFVDISVVDSAWSALDQQGKWFVCKCRDNV